MNGQMGEAATHPAQPKGPSLLGTSGALELPAPDHQRGSLSEAPGSGVARAVQLLGVAVSGVGISVWQSEYAWVSHLRVCVVGLLKVCLE